MGKKKIKNFLLISNMQTCIRDKNAPKKSFAERQFSELQVPK
jgi:hypothetical protein